MKTILTLLLMQAGFVYAQTTYNWLGAGADNNMGTLGNWLSTTPAGDDILIFDNSTRTTPFNNLVATNRHQIIFNSSASAFILSGITTNSFDFHSPNAPKIQNNSNFSQTINFPILCSYTTMHFNPVGANMIIGGGVNNNGHDIVIGGNTGKTLTFNGGISGTGKLIVDLNTNVLLAINPCTYSGTTQIDTGKLTTEVPMSTSTILINGGTFESKNANILPDATKITLTSGSLIFKDHEVIGDLTLYNGIVHIDSGKVVKIMGVLKIAGSTYAKTGKGIITYDSLARLEYACGGNDTSSSFEWPLGTPSVSLTNNTTVVLHDDRSISRTMTFTNGILVSSAANLLTFEDGSMVMGGNSASYVSGPVKKIGDNPFIFPVGKDGKWARLRISEPANVTDAFIVEYFKTAYSDLTVDSPLSNVSAVEYWMVDRASGSSAVDVTLYYEDGAFSGITNTPTTSNVIVAVYNSLTGNWQDLGGTRGVSGNATAGTVSQDSIYRFSPVTFGSIGNGQPLPVKLISLNATKVGTTSLIEWVTATEINNEYFSIQRRTDDNEYIEIGTLQGSGNSQVNVNYTFIDVNPIPNATNYYRVVQHDYDGNSETFGPVYVKFDSPVNITTWPNPFTNSIFVSVPEGVTDGVIRVCDVMGKVVYEKFIDDSQPQVSLSTEAWTQGNYFVTVSWPSFQKTNLVVKL